MGWAHFFLERGQRGEIPVPSDFTVERGHSIFLLNVYTFLGKFLSFFFFFKQFMTFSGNQVQQQHVETNLKSQQIHTDVGTKAYQFIILRQNQREV